MELTPRATADLLAAWALDALDADERALIDAMLVDDDALRRTADRLRGVVEDLGTDAARPAPVAVRAAIVDAVRARPRTPPHATDPVELFANQVDALHALLADLDESDWRRPVAPYGWTVHGLVAHLLVIERYTSGQFGMSDPPADADASHLAMGADAIAGELRRAPAATAAAWTAAATATIDWLRAGGRAADEPVTFHRWPFRTSTLLVARAFEVWTHADDIRRATGRPVATPEPGDLRSMSQFSVTSLPLLVPLVAPDRDVGGARVVLTGAGGGTFDIGDGHDAVVVVDVVDYCRHAARRVDRALLDVTIEGDAEVAERLLAAAQLFAV